jgi:hypothetical protein
MREVVRKVRLPLCFDDAQPWLGRATDAVLAASGTVDVHRVALMVALLLGVAVADQAFRHVTCSGAVVLRVLVRCRRLQRVRICYNIARAFATAVTSSSLENGLRRISIVQPLDCPDEPDQLLRGGVGS